MSALEEARNRLRKTGIFGQEDGSGDERLSAYSKGVDALLQLLALFSAFLTAFALSELSSGEWMYGYAIVAGVLLGVSGRFVGMRYMYLFIIAWVCLIALRWYILNATLSTVMALFCVIILFFLVAFLGHGAPVKEGGRVVGWVLSETAMNYAIVAPFFYPLLLDIKSFVLTMGGFLWFFALLGGGIFSKIDCLLYDFFGDKNGRFIDT